MILCIDPGVMGGLAYDLDGHSVAVPMPKTEGDIIANLQGLKMMTVSPHVAYLEQIVKHMGIGTPASTMAVYASNWGFILGALMMGGWKVEIVTPQKWQKELGLGITGRQKSDVKGMSPSMALAEKKRIRTLNATLKREWKRKLYGAAQRLYPDIKVTLQVADALLILAYARRMERHGTNEQSNLWPL